MKAGPEHASRYFQGSSWVVECGDALNKDITVGLNGLQFANGHITRVINTALGEHDALDPLTPAQARELARALFEAAGVIDTLAENEVDSLAD